MPESPVREHLPSHLPQIEKIVGKMVYDKSNVDDITQECCLRILEKEGLWKRDPNVLRHWMNVISSNLVKSTLRKLKVEKSKEDSLNFELTKKMDMDGADFSDEHILWVLKQFGSLSKRQKQVLIMRYFQGMKVIDIAKELNISQAGVSAYIAKSIQKLQSQARSQGLFSFALFWKWAFSSDSLFRLQQWKMAISLFLLSAVTLVCVASPSNSVWPEADKVSVPPPYHEASHSASMTVFSQNKTDVTLLTQGSLQQFFQEQPELMRSQAVNQTVVFKKDRHTVHKAIDLGIKQWANRDVLIPHRVALLKDALNRLPDKTPQSHEKVLTVIKELIETDFGGDMKKYVESTLPKTMNVTNKHSVYMIYFMNPYDSEGIATVNRLQEEYLNKGVRVCGVVKAMVNPIAPKGWRPKSQNDLPPDPTYYPRSVEAYLKLFEGKKDKVPNFLVGIDVKSVYESPIRGYFNLVADQRMKYPRLFVINKESQIVWGGEAKNVRYYMKDILNGRYGWDDFYKIYKSAPRQIENYLKLNAATSLKIRQEAGESFLTDFSGAPDTLVKLSREILKRGIFNCRDVTLAMSCCQLAQKNAGMASREIEETLADVYTEAGYLDKALAQLKKVRKIYLASKENTEIVDAKLKKLNVIKRKWGAKKYLALKKAEILFSLEYWPCLRDRRSDKSILVNMNKTIIKGFKHDRLLTGEIIFQIFRNPRIDFKNEALRKLSEKLIKAAVEQIPKLPTKEDHIVFAAEAMYKHYMGQKGQAASSMKKALALKPGREHAEIYTVILRKVLRK